MGRRFTVAPEEPRARRHEQPNVLGQLGRERVRQVDAAQRTSALEQSKGNLHLINPTALPVIGIVDDRRMVPAFAGALPVLHTEPDWLVPITVGDLVDLDELGRGWSAA